MRRRTVLALGIPALLSGAPSILGRWRSVTTTKGGIGAVYDFRSNGAAHYSSVALVDMDYRLNATVLTLGGQSIGIGWHQDGRLQFNFGNDVVEDFTRQGQPPSAQEPLLGEWSGTRMMQNHAIPVTMQFHSGGRSLMVLFLKTHAGRYKPTPSQQDAWTATIPSLPSRGIRLLPASNQLEITVQGGDPHLFARY